MSKVLALSLAAALASGCASTPSTTAGTGSGASYVPMVDMQGVDSDKFAGDVGACREVASSVRVMRLKGQGSDVLDAVVLGVGIVVPFGFVGMAAISGIYAAIDDGSAPSAKPADDNMQRTALVNCMARKGYRNVDPNVTVTYMPPRQPAPDAVPRRTGHDTYMAESYAKENFCQGPARAVLDSKGPGFERYTVTCGGGRPLHLRCEFGNCAQESIDVALGQ